MSKRLVILGEGEGDRAALPVMAEKLVGEKNAWDAVFVDRNVIKGGGLSKLVGGNGQFAHWIKLFQYGLKRPNVGAMLAVFDGDLDHMPGDKRAPFCARTIATQLAHVARREAGLGQRASLAVVVARQEYESWMIGGITSIQDRLVPARREASVREIDATGCNLEESPRDAKGWLNERLSGGYKAVRNQAELTHAIDLERLRQRQDLRSFRRLDHAMDQLIHAVRHGQHVCTPA